MRVRLSRNKCKTFTVNKLFYSVIFCTLIFGVSGCHRFDYTKVPLYDEVFIKEEERWDNTRRKPQENPRVVNRSEK